MSLLVLVFWAEAIPDTPMDLEAEYDELLAVVDQPGLVDEAISLYMHSRVAEDTPYNGDDWLTGESASTIATDRAIFCQEYDGRFYTREVELNKIDLVYPQEVTT